MFKSGIYVDKKRSLQGETLEGSEVIKLILVVS